MRCKGSPFSLHIEVLIVHPTPFLTYFTSKGHKWMVAQPYFPNELLSLQQQFALFMKKTIQEWLGLPMVYAGVILMTLLYAFDLTRYNLLLLLPLLFTLAGIFFFTRNEKRKGDY